MKFSRVLAIARKEVMHILRDPFTAGMALGLPIIMVVYFGFAIDFDFRNVKLALYDFDNTRQSRQLADVFIASSARDTDLSVRLCDVYPDGKSYLMAEGMLRLRHRNSKEISEPLTPGKIEEVSVDCWSTSVVFNKGHRIRATVTSSNFPRFDVNPGTGKPWSDGGEAVPQTNKIFCEGGHASHLILPVVAPKLAAAK